MFRSTFFAIVFSTLQIFSVVHADTQSSRVVGAVQELDSSRADFTLFVRIAGDNREFRIADTNGQGAENTIRALQRSFNATTNGQPVRVEITYNQDLVITSAVVKN